METVKTITSKLRKAVQTIVLFLLLPIALLVSYFVCTSARQGHAIKIWRIVSHAVYLSIFAASIVLLALHHYFFGIIFFIVGMCDLFNLFMEVDMFAFHGEPIITQSECINYVHAWQGLLNDWSEQFPRSLFGRAWIKHKENRPDWRFVYM